MTSALTTPAVSLPELLQAATELFSSSDCLSVCTHNFVAGGYAFVETSQIPLQGGRILNPGAVLKSPLLHSTGPEGSCINFA